MCFNREDHIMGHFTVVSAMNGLVTLYTDLTVFIM